ECAYRKDWNHVITLANRNFRKMFSDPTQEPRDLTGLTDYDLFSEEYADQSYELEEQVLAGLPVAYVAQRTVRGRKERLDHRKFPVWDQGEQITGLFTIIAVTTERVLAERALRANEESLRGAQKIAGVGTFVLDVQGQTWTASDALYEILGIDNGCECRLAVWTDLIREEDLAALVKLYGDMVLGKSKMLDGETRFIPDRWGLAVGACEGQACLGRAGKATHTLRGTIEDISDRKLA